MRLLASLTVRVGPGALRAHSSSIYGMMNTNAADRTFLFAAEPGDRIELQDVDPAIITVHDTRRPRKTTRR